MDVPGLLSTLSQAVNGLRLYSELKTDAERNAAVLAVQQDLIRVYSDAMKMAEELMAMRDELRRLQDWQAEAARYELVEVAQGVVVRQLRSDRANGEPIHRLCPQCFEDRKKSYLRHFEAAMFGWSLICDRCKSEIPMDSARVLPKIQYPRSGIV
jgi:hypothetical protein